MLITNYIATQKYGREHATFVQEEATGAWGLICKWDGTAFAYGTKIGATFVHGRESQTSSNNTWSLGEFLQNQTEVVPRLVLRIKIDPSYENALACNFRRLIMVSVEGRTEMREVPWAKNLLFREWEWLEPFTFASMNNFHKP